ncbi:helicase HerA domain-containing protein [Granulicatella sp. zg-ZJ]|uniref:helicase HerA domain-containing protein n=1 Tax=Granulicatella sp. zg-ZJ TaxID=2678504 RepID=UPI00351AE3D3
MHSRDTLQNLSSASANYLTKILNTALPLNGENSYTNSYSIQLEKNDKGFFFIPHLPVSYPIDRKLYFQIADICSAVLYPYKTLLVQNNAYFTPYNVKDPNLARAFFFPWIDGIPTRLEIERLNRFIETSVKEEKIPIMANNVSLNMNEVVHMAISGSSGSGKSYFVEYLIRCLHSFTDQIVLVDPKMADIFILGKELRLETLSPHRGSNLNSFITDVNELLGRAINMIYERQEMLLKNPKANFKRSYIIIDELLALVQGSPKQARETFAQLLGTIALLGRATKTSLILISQRFDAPAFGGNLAVREQINCSVILGEINSNTTQFLLPNAHVDNIVVPIGHGTGIIKLVNGKNDNHIMPLLTPTYKKERENNLE